MKESIECKGEAEFHSVTDRNYKQEGETSLNSLMVIKVTQLSNGALIPTFIYTTETVRTICVKVFLPEPVHVSFLNEYDCVLEFSM